MKLEDTAPQQRIDITKLYFQFKEKWRNVFIYRLGEQDFIYRALGRKEFKDICNDKNFNDFEKEEIICDECVLYPKDYDWQECDAGIPTELMKHILKNSYLDDNKSYAKVLDFYRNDMWDVDNQVTAIISEAFPNLDIEVIEQWDVEKTMKYLSRAEWTLHNLRGVPFNPISGGEDENLKEQSIQENANTYKKQENKTNDDKKTIRGGSRKNKLTPEKLAQLQAKFPGIDWAHDDGLRGIDGLAQSGLDDTPPALRVGR